MRRMRRKEWKKYGIMMLCLAMVLDGCQKQGSKEGTAAIQADPTTQEVILSKEATTEEPAKEGLPLEAFPKEDAAFDGSVVTIAKSDKALATEITRKEIQDMVREVTYDLDMVVQNGQTVVIKPNLVQMKVDSTGDLLDKEVNGVTTDWRVTDAVVQRVRELNPDGKVYIMEGSASGPTSKVMKYYHYTHKYIENVDGFISLEEDCGDWQDFDAPEVVKVDLPGGLLHQSYYFNRILYEADVLISIPCLKTSSGVVVTAGIKNISLGTPPGNLYGLSPENPSKSQMVSHKIIDGELDKWIYDYYSAKPIDYVIVDGLQGFQSGPVPMSQDRKETDKMNMGVILGGKDAVAVDTICALSVGWDPESVGYLKHFRENMRLGKLENIRVKGKFVNDLRKYFTIKRPELGGVQITDDMGPVLSAHVKAVDNQQLLLAYKTNKDAYKLELFMDDYFYASVPARTKETLTLDIRNFTQGKHQIQVIAYDHFLNRTAKSFGFTVPEEKIPGES